VTVPALAPRPALVGCELRPDLNIMGLTLMTSNAAGRLVGRWLGAYPLACEGDTYQLAIAANALTALEQAAGDPGLDGNVYLAGDFPYFGDGVCVVGAVRRWWRPGEIGGQQAEQHWDGTSVPVVAPAFPCPVNQPGDGLLVLQPGG